MAAITGTYGLVKRSHLSVRVALGSADDNIANSDLVTTSGLAALSGIAATNSPLYSFLTTAYADAAAAETAFRAIGGDVRVRPISVTGATIISVTWTCTAAVPSLTFTAGVNADVLQVVISVPHSVSQ